MGTRHQAQVHRGSNKHSGCIGSEMRNSLYESILAIIIRFLMQRKQRPLPTGGRGQRKMQNTM